MRSFDSEFLPGKHSGARDAGAVPQPRKAEAVRTEDVRQLQLNESSMWSVGGKEQ